jgi:hypothetical protein
VGNISCSFSKVVPFQNHSMLFNKILFLVPIHCNSSISLNQIFHLVPSQQLDIFLNDMTRGTHQFLWHFVPNLGQADFKFGQCLVFCTAEFGQSVCPKKSSKLFSNLGVWAFGFVGWLKILPEIKVVFFIQVLVSQKHARCNNFG